MTTETQNEESQLLKIKLENGDNQATILYKASRMIQEVFRNSIPIEMKPLLSTLEELTAQKDGKIPEEDIDSLTQAIKSLSSSLPEQVNAETQKRIRQYLENLIISTGDINYQYTWFETITETGGNYPPIRNNASVTPKGIIDNYNGRLLYSVNNG